MTQVIVSEKADADTTEILAYLTREAGAATARKYVAKLDGLYDRLKIFPAIGTARPNFGPHARITTVPPYLIVYDFTGDTLTILRVVHGRRNITADILK